MNATKTNPIPVEGAKFEYTPIGKVVPLDLTGGIVDAVYDHVLILRPLPSDETEGGIVLPDRAKIAEHYGYVARVGPKVEGVAPGDWVTFGIESARDIKLGDPTKAVLTVVSEQAIFCRLSTEKVRQLGLRMPELDIDKVLVKP